MKKKTTIALTVFIIIFVAAIVFLIASVPFVFSDCGKTEIEKKDVTNIEVEVLTAGGEQLYSCSGAYDGVELKADRDYTLRITAQVKHYGNENGMVSVGSLLLNYGDVSIDLDAEYISLTERVEEDKRVEYPEEAGYYYLTYILRGTKCSDKKIELDYKAEFRNIYDGYEFLPCSLTVKFL